MYMNMHLIQNDEVYKKIKLSNNVICLIIKYYEHLFTSTIYIYVFIIMKKQMALHNT